MTPSPNSAMKRPVYCGCRTSYPVCLVKIARRFTLHDAIEDARLPTIAPNFAHHELGVGAAARVLHLYPGRLERRERPARYQRQTIGGAIERPVWVTPLLPSRVTKSDGRLEALTC